MTADEAMRRLNIIAAHLWMVRRFLKHAEELEQAPHLHEVHRQIFDYVRVLEPSWQRQDAQEYLRRARGKLPRLKRAAELLASQYRQVSDHTNFEMAALSLSGCVQQIEELLNAVSATPVVHTSSVSAAARSPESAGVNPSSGATSEHQQQG